MPYLSEHQSKGLEHCRDIFKAAKMIHKAYDYKKPLRQCLLEALRNHRLLLFDLSQAQGESLPFIVRGKPKQSINLRHQQQQHQFSAAHIEQMHMGDLDMGVRNWPGEW